MTVIWYERYLLFCGGQLGLSYNAQVFKWPEYILATESHVFRDGNGISIKVCIYQKTILEGGLDQREHRVKEQLIYAEKHKLYFYNQTKCLCFGNKKSAKCYKFCSVGLTHRSNWKIEILFAMNGDYISKQITRLSRIFFLLLGIFWSWHHL